MKQPCTDPPSEEHFPEMMKTHLSQLTGRTDVSGAQIAGLVRLVANRYESHSTRRLGDFDLSGPRLGILMRLEAHSRFCGAPGLTPTDLSHDQRVSKNTVSALLNGLEEQGLIERRLDPADRRVFRIVISDLGTRLVRETAPLIVDHLNELVSNLSQEERSTLIQLLGKLFHSLRSHEETEAVEYSPTAHTQS